MNCGLMPFLTRTRFCGCALAAALIVLTPCSFAMAATTGAGGFDRYMEIIRRAPFGEVAPPEMPSEAPIAPPGESFVQNLEMRAIIDDGITIRVGFLDKRQQKNIYLTVGESVDGIELVSVDYDNEEALLRKGQETSLFTLRPSGAADKAAPAMMPTSPAKSLARRRPFFTNTGKQAPPTIMGGAGVNPFKGKTIEAFLRENPEAALQYPSPISVTNAAAFMQGKGKTIEQFLQDNPDAASRFSPFQTFSPTNRVEGRGETIERFMREHSGEAQQLQPPTPIFESPESVPFLFEDVPDEELFYE